MVLHENDPFRMFFIIIEGIGVIVKRGKQSPSVFD